MTANFLIQQGLLLYEYDCGEVIILHPSRDV